MRRDEVLERIKSMADPEAVKGMARFGISANNNYGVSVYKLRSLAKEIGRDHGLALELWRTGIHDARLLAALVDEPARVTDGQMEDWVKDIDSWDICDITCAHLFDQTPYAYAKAFEWSKRREEFVKRAGFVLMAALSVHDKKAEDKEFLKFLPVIKRESTDERNYVKKAVNWALRQIGKRNLALNAKAIKAGEEIKRIDSKAARWIASDALRELRSEKVQARLKAKA